MASYLITGLRVFMQIPICIDYFSKQSIHSRLESSLRWECG